MQIFISGNIHLPDNLLIQIFDETIPDIANQLYNLIVIDQTIKTQARIAPYEVYERLWKSFGVKLLFLAGLEIPEILSAHEFCAA
jgi:hypothetical protein